MTDAWRKTGERVGPVSAFALRRPPTDIPDPVLQRAALLLLDTLGIAAAAAPMDAGRIARDAAAEMFGGSAARMLFDGRAVSVPGALFAAATQIDNLDGHDGYNPSKGHIGVVAAPTLAALGGGLTGTEALATLVIGYEVAGRAAEALHGTACDYHTSGAWNALGVVAMAARLRRLSQAQLREALGIAEYHGPRSQMMREIATPTMLHDGSGWGALAGMSAVVLAEKGFTGAPAVTVEAPEVERYWADLGDRWLTLEQYVKPYPTCRWSHAAIDAVRDLMLAEAIDAARVTAIRIASFAPAVALWGAMPATTSQAQYSLAFGVAIMLVHAQIGLAQISGAGLTDPAVARLVALTETRVHPGYDARFPAERWAEVEIDLADGRTLASGPVRGRGGRGRPFDEDQIVTKFHEYADPVLGAARADALSKAVMALPEGDPFNAVLAQIYDPVTGQ